VRRTVVTTSWDDGHPLDLRIAELLNKYGLTGTFYVPFEAPRPVMDAGEIRQLSTTFEIGAHTVHHTPLTEISAGLARREIETSKGRIEDLTGVECTSFCFPKGKFTRVHLPMLREAGFVLGRTVEILSLSPPVSRCGVMVMATSVQAFSHSPSGLLRNAGKRMAIAGLYGWIRHCRKLDWVDMLECLLPHAVRQGGVFHLWGHSWEIEENGEWEKLEHAFQLLAQYRREVDYLTNSQVVRSAFAAA
jgi:peptidoglycan/xylan/chitin deacetylase (PgdA/CDA1 family)